MKCAGVGVAKFSKNTHVRCGSVRSEKLLCAECAGVPKLAAHKYSVNIYVWFESIINGPEAILKVFLSKLGSN